MKFLLMVLIINAIISVGWHYWIDDHTPLDARLIFTTLFTLYVWAVINLVRSKEQ